MDSPWINGALDFQFGSDELSPAATRERYQISLTRLLPWQLHSGFVFGGTSQTVTTSLSKPLLPYLNCTVENRQNFSQSGVEQLARFNYQMRF